MEIGNVPVEISMQFCTWRMAGLWSGRQCSYPLLVGLHDNCKGSQKALAAVEKMRCRNKELTPLAAGNWDWDSSLGGDAWPISSLFLEARSPLYLCSLILTLVILAKIHRSSIRGFFAWRCRKSIWKRHPEMLRSRSKFSARLRELTLRAFGLHGMRSRHAALICPR
jgi:hypothetical protein